MLVSVSVFCIVPAVVVHACFQYMQMYRNMLIEICVDLHCMNNHHVWPWITADATFSRPLRILGYTAAAAMFAFFQVFFLLVETGKSSMYHQRYSKMAAEYPYLYMYAQATATERERE